ncbi:MAG: hypothetical protein ABIF06_02420 [bacterium]
MCRKNLTTNPNRATGAKETEMSSEYRIYGRTVEQGVTEDGARVEWANGCNGEKHAGWLDKVFYNAEGEVEYAEHLTVVERGACDQTCTSEEQGWFLHPCPPIPAVKLTV